VAGKKRPQCFSPTPSSLHCLSQPSYSQPPFPMTDMISQICSRTPNWAPVFSTVYSFPIMVSHCCLTFVGVLPGKTPVSINYVLEIWVEPRRRWVSSWRSGGLLEVVALEVSQWRESRNRSPASAEICSNVGVTFTP
jgi:hypothetical protein